MIKELFSLFKYILFFLVLGLIINFYVMYVCQVSGSSMNPSLDNKDRLLVSKIPTYSNDFMPNRFDIVIFEYNNRSLIKRVIGLPGDSIYYEDDKLFINGENFEETYLGRAVKEFERLEQSYTKDFTLISEVPEGAVFVLGDNRTNSLDSRALGFIPIEDIDGIAITRFFPFDDFEWNVSEVTINDSDKSIEGSEREWTHY